MSNAAATQEPTVSSPETQAPSRLPAYGRVFRQLVYFLLRGNSGGLLLVLAGLGLAWIGLVSWLRYTQGEVGYGGVSNLAWVLGLLIAYQTWDGEPPSKRTYHRSQPVPEPIHDLLRVAAGVVFLAVAFLVVVAAEVVAMGIAAPGWARDVSAAHWLLFPLVPLAAYLVGSVASVASERPGRWMVGVPAAVLGLVAIVGLTHESPGELWFMTFYTGTVGLGPLMGATVIFEPVSTWVPAALFWIGVGAVGVVVAAHRRRGAR